ncbi:SDR family NAD(P)-dependent oxidoreductase [Micromonospora sp. NPDC005367]|uniref:SDR family NAD(P)-dependent oxidoreductase n=1 Tax=Micromonospora sp. NPDC005367 TaxID=3155590 RepID=UPI00339DC221
MDARDTRQTWLVTGAARGLGLHLARAVLESGDHLVATARTPAQLDGLVETYGDQVRPYALDVTDPEAARRAVGFATEQFGRLDVVVNNAGYANSAPIEEMPEEDFRAQIETNLFGVVNVTRAALPVLRRQRGGTFVQISSVGGRVGGSPGLGAYQAAKFAVEGFSEVLANETAPFGVKVIIVEPGAFRTDWQGTSMRLHDVGADYQDSVGRMHRLRRETDGAQPGDPARAAAVIVDIVGHEAPPRRLLLGADAVEAALRSGAERNAEAEEWAEISRSTGFPT